MDRAKKEGRYQRLYTQIEGLMHKPGNGLSKMATIAAVLHHKLEYFFWTGFYLLDNDKLQVGPYQGPVACQELEKNKGVCWAGINGAKTVVVEDVHKFPGHIACDSRSKSEIVVPLKTPEGNIIGVLDVDSGELASFDDVDAQYLEKIVSLIFLPS
jgi:GAF domain-containing protein